MDPIGYPSVVLYLALIIGLPLAFIKPYKAFIVVTFFTIALDSASLTYTRTTLLGPYFNANDAFLLITFTATMSYCVALRNKIHLPEIVKYMVAVLIVGFIQSLYVCGEPTYEIIRAMRWAIAMPLYFIFSATIADDEKKVKPLLIAILFGSLFSVLQHILFVTSRIEMYVMPEIDIGHFRTLAFSNPGIWLLLAGIVWIPKIKFIYRPFLYIAAVLFAVSVVLNQTRSIWISSIAALPITIFMFKQKDYCKKSVIIIMYTSILVFGVFQVISHILPDIKTGDIILQRLEPYTEQDRRYEATFDRQMDFKLEVEEWMKGTLIFGRGLSYFTSESYADDDSGDVAWGHLGHITTLAQLGLIGLFVYSYLLPIAIVKYSKKLWQFATDETKYLGLLAGVCMISSWICFIMSGSFLSHNVTAGIIYGSTYRQARNIST